MYADGAGFKMEILDLNNVLSSFEASRQNIRDI